LILKCKSYERNEKTEKEKNRKGRRETVRPSRETSPRPIPAPARTGISLPHTSLTRGPSLSGSSSLVRKICRRPSLPAFTPSSIPLKSSSVSSPHRAYKKPHSSSPFPLWIPSSTPPGCLRKARRSPPLLPLLPVDSDDCEELRHPLWTLIFFTSSGARADALLFDFFCSEAMPGCSPESHRRPAPLQPTPSSYPASNRRRQPRR
jgi:hypothetical protein